MSARPGHPPRDLQSLLESEPTGEEVFDAQTEDDGEVRHLCFDTSQDVQAEPGPILQGAAVLVGPGVLSGGKELRDKVPVSPVQLDEIEACPARVARSIDEGLCRLLDACFADLRWHYRLGLHLVDGGRNRGRGDGCLARDGTAGPGAAVTELDRDAGSGVV